MAIVDGTIHPKFKLNGVSYASSRLKELAYDLVKEGSSFEKSIGNFLSIWLDENLTVAVNTSGSTGIPKSILLQKEHMVNSALVTGNYFGLKEGNTALLCLPVDYIAGKMMLVRALVLGLELDYVEPSSNPILALSKSYDFAAMVPLQLESCLPAIEKIKTLIVGGAVISEKLRKQVMGKSAAIFETYGMTETITHVAVRTVGQDSDEDHNNPYFMALPNVSFSLDDRDCLIISAPLVAVGPVVTNDMVNLLSATEFQWLGRFDNVINSGGIKLFPEQLEVKLAPFLSTRFFVTGVPDETLGQKLVLVAEGEIDGEKVLQSLKNEGELEWFEIPKKVYSTPKLKETDTGKIQRKESLKLLGL